MYYFSDSNEDVICVFLDSVEVVCMCGWQVSHSKYAVLSTCHLTGRILSTGQYSLCVTLLCVFNYNYGVHHQGQIAQKKLIGSRDGKSRVNITHKVLARPGTLSFGFTWTIPGVQLTLVKQTIHSKNDHTKMYLFVFLWVNVTNCIM